MDNHGENNNNFENSQGPSYSFDLTPSFLQYCASYMMHGDDVPYAEDVLNTEKEEDDMLPVIDLIQADENDEEDFNSIELNGDFESDRWTKNARLLLRSIEDMSDYLKRSSYAYVGSFALPYVASCNAIHDAIEHSKIIMNDTDKSIFESTVTSFTVSTANQIEQLRQTAAADTEKISNRDVKGHREGIVAILLHHLQTKIMAVMSDLHKIRTRKAIKEVLNEPLGCCKGFLSIPVQLTMNEMRDMGMEGNLAPNHIQRMLQTNPSYFPIEIEPPAHVNGNYFQFKQKEVDEMHHFLSSSKGSTPFIVNTPKPITTQIPTDTTNTMHQTNQKRPPATPPPRSKPLPSAPKIQQQYSQHSQHSQPANRNVPYNENSTKSIEQEEAEMEYMQNLQRENALLTSQIQQSTQSMNEIHQIEQSMMQITSLLNQFSNLISEQQEDVVFIQEAAQDTKDTLEKGTDNIVDATERAKKGSHYMAKSIYAMGIVLLFLNWAL